MKEGDPLFDKNDRKNERIAPARKLAGKDKTKGAGISKKVEDRTLVLKPVTAELRRVTLRQRVLPRYIFEQLITEPVLDANTAEPRGTVLGQVNMHNAHCQRAKEDHLHLIWIHEGQLRYGLVWRTRPIQRYGELEEAIHDRTIVLAMMRALAGWCPVELPGRTSLEPPICVVAVGLEEFRYRPPDALVELWALTLGQPLPDFITIHRRPLGDPQKLRLDPRPVETVKAEVEALLTEKRPIRGTPEDVERELLQLCEEHRILRERWQQYYDKWHALPQIFISR
jgi:hypothetical protein